MDNNWRWVNVPLFLRTGKRLRQKRSEIVIEFSDLPFSIIPDGPRKYGNRLVIQLQPEESIQLQMVSKEPGSGLHELPVNLNLDLQQALTGRRAEAYERLLIDVIRGRPTHLPLETSAYQGCSKRSRYAIHIMFFLHESHAVKALDERMSLLDYPHSAGSATD